MVISKREKIILTVAIIAIGILIADRYIITPAFAIRAQTKADKQMLLGEMATAQSLFKRKKLLQRKWQQLVAGGLTDNASKTESKLLHAIGDWSQEYGLTISSVKPERVNGKGDFRELSLIIAATGDISKIGLFLWQIENTDLPMKIKDIQLSSRDEDATEMSLQLKLSAIYLPTDNKEL